MSQAARLAKRNRTDFYKLLARRHISYEDFKTQRMSLGGDNQSKEIQ